MSAPVPRSTSAEPSVEAVVPTMPSPAVATRAVAAMAIRSRRSRSGPVDRDADVAVGVLLPGAAAPADPRSRARGLPAGVLTS